MDIDFYPMNQPPEISEGDSFSKTVIVYDEDLEYSDLGFFDFESSQWHIFGEFSMNLKCWCYIPNVDTEKVKSFKTSTHHGYRK